MVANGSGIKVGGKVSSMPSPGFS